MYLSVILPVSSNLRRFIFSNPEDWTEKWIYKERQITLVVLVSDLGRLSKLIHLSNSHASLAPEVSNNPIKLRVLNSGLIWILHHSSNSQIIEMIPEIEFAIMKLLIQRFIQFDSVHVFFSYFRFPLPCPVTVKSC